MNISQKFVAFSDRGVFSTGAMGALAPTILKNRLLAPAIFGHFCYCRKKLWMLNKNLINTQHPQYQNPKFTTVTLRLHFELGMGILNLPRKLLFGGLLTS